MMILWMILSMRLAMALGYIGLVNHNRVSLCAFGETGGLQRLSDMRGRRRTREMGSWLLGLEPGGAGTFDEAMKTAAQAQAAPALMLAQVSAVIW